MNIPYKTHFHSFIYVINSRKNTMFIIRIIYKITLIINDIKQLSKWSCTTKTISAIAMYHYLVKLLEYSRIFSHLSEYRYDIKLTVTLIIKIN